VHAAHAQTLQEQQTAKLLRACVFQQPGSQRHAQTSRGLPGASTGRAGTPHQRTLRRGRKAHRLHPEYYQVLRLLGESEEKCLPAANVQGHHELKGDSESHAPPQHPRGKQYAPAQQRQPDNKSSSAQVENIRDSYETS
jgi:hypothetical protein